MKFSMRILVRYYALFLVILGGLSLSGKAQAPDYLITPVPFSQVTITDTFWAEKIRINHEVTIPIAFQRSEESGRIDNFRKAAGLMEGPFGTQYPFDDSDVFKVIEAASYSLQTYPDPAMRVRLDSIIEIIGKAQEADGYLYTNRTIKVGTPHAWIGDRRWVNVNELSHELYNLGHLFEAAAAHYTATGQRNLLDIALKAADLICDTFGPGKEENYPGHQEVEIGLVKLYRITGERKYLNLAKYFLDIRGREGIGRQNAYNQSHIPVTEQTHAVGHSVRASYMWTAMADVAALTGDSSYIRAINALWHDVVDTKYYLNGGIGSTASHEGFGAEYELPNMTAYNETCAGVGNATWNYRMFLMTGESKYIDVLERTMYNNILTGVSCTGDHFFYPNPLASEGQHARREWFGCACCPPNVARFLPSMPGYIYAHRGDTVYVNLLISSSTTIDLPTGRITIAQQSGLPWDGKVVISVTPENPSTHAVVMVRIPGWANNQPVPGDLYKYESPQQTLTTILTQHALTMPHGYCAASGHWNTGDNIEMRFDLQPRVVVANAHVAADRQRIAIERGPLLYCAEWPENGDVLDLVIDNQPALEANVDEDLFGGIVTITTTGRHVHKADLASADGSGPVPITFIPYYLWNNRGPGEMEVWIATSEEAASVTDDK